MAWQQPEEHEVEQAKAHKLWPAFDRWCEEEGYAIDCQGHPDDWWPWWKCFLAGAVGEQRLQRQT